MAILQQLESEQCNHIHHIQDLGKYQEQLSMRAALNASQIPPQWSQLQQGTAGLDTQDEQATISLTKAQFKLLQGTSMSQPNNADSGSNLWPSLAATTTDSLLKKEIIALSLCDGMGCLAIALQRIRAVITRYIGVENDEIARVICQNCNPQTIDFPGVDHSWKSDVFGIKEADIAALGFDVIKILGLGPPCEDQSRLRLIRSKAQQQNGKDPRPGLDGPKH